MNSFLTENNEPTYVAGACAIDRTYPDLDRNISRYIMSFTLFDPVEHTVENAATNGRLEVLKYLVEHRGADVRKK